MTVGDSSTPRTFAEQLDAAKSGEEFADVLQALFGALEAARDEPCGDHYVKWNRVCTEPAGHSGRHRNACVSWDNDAGVDRG